MSRGRGRSVIKLDVQGAESAKVECRHAKRVCFLSHRAVHFSDTVLKQRQESRVERYVQHMHAKYQIL